MKSGVCPAVCDMLREGPNTGSAEGLKKKDEWEELARRDASVCVPCFGWSGWLLCLCSRVVIVSLLQVLCVSNGWSVSCPRSVLSFPMLVVYSVYTHEGLAAKG
jgi:hypothetical protein